MDKKLQRRHLLVVLMMSALISACGATAQSLVPSPVVVTEVVPQTVVVTRVATQLATVVVTATPPPASPTTALPKAGKWEVVTDTSSFDDSQTVVLFLDSENTIAGSFDDYRPVLVLRCQENTIDAYIDVGMPADIEMGNLDGATARIRFGRDEAQTVNMGRSTDDKALFFEQPDEIIKTMEQHEQMIVGFTPFNAVPVEMTFDLRGLPEAIESLRSACN